YSAAVVEVEADARTGIVDVTKVWIAHDIGRAINPVLVIGQVEGSVYMGLGEALMEEQEYRLGLHKWPSMLEYKSPTFLETPPKGRGSTSVLRLPRLRYLRPSSPREAAQLAAEHGARAMLVAGGTDLIPNLKRRQFDPEVLVQVPSLPGIRRDDGHFVLGATVTLAEASADQSLRAALPGFAEAAGLVSSPPLRNAGTVGG